MFISIFKMSLALLGIVSALNIDNELRVIKIDCYERLAIGERLDPNKVYKSFPYNTVGDCKKACSEENSVCKAFSFGISAKGNATCELSVDAIKETADLKPIGTVKNTDFDLYIKKLGCTIVSEPPHRKPPTQSEHNLSNKPDTLGNVKDEVSHHDTTIESVSNPPSTYSVPNPQDEVHHVQTLVSIAHGPQTVLDPAHGILVAGGHLNSYSTENDALSNWYNQYDINNYRPQLSYSSFSSSNSYTGVNYDLKPHGSTGYSDIDRYDYLPDDNRIYADRYGEKMPPRPYFHSDYNYRRPLPNSYGSVIPHPDQYYKRPTHQDYKPNYYGSDMEYHYHRPSKPFIDKPNHQYDAEYPYNKPYKPEQGAQAAYHYNKPLRPFSERPNNEYGGDYHYSQPSKPFVDRPVHESNYYNPPPKPFNEKPVHENNVEKGSKPVSLSLIYEIENPVMDPQTDKRYQGPPKNVNNPATNDVKYFGYDYSPKPIVTHTTGYKGEQITSIITEIKDKGKSLKI